MRLNLSISSAQAHSLADSSSTFFHLRGGTIGRGRDNDWVLPDAERVISTHHGIIHYESGQYLYEDTSSNGSFLNDLNEPMPRGQFVPLHHGDLLYIGDYEIQVELTEDSFSRSASPRAGLPETTPPSDFVPRPYVPNSSIPPQTDGAWDSLHQDKHPSQSSAFPNNWGQSESQPPSFASNPAAPTTQADHIPAEQQHFNPPTPVAEIIREDAGTPINEVLPENWWDEASDTSPVASNADSASQGVQRIPEMDFPIPTGPAGSDIPHSLSEGAADPFAETSNRNIPLAAESIPARVMPIARTEPSADVGRAQPAPAPDAALAQEQPAPNASDQTPSRPDALLAAFLDGLAVQPSTALTEAQATELMQLTGRLLRLLTQSTAEVLQARSALKSEFRLTQTILRPAENNPLKFSLNLDQTLRDLLLENRPGYIDPESAFQEAMLDIKHHEIAVMAGMRAAFECLIDKFSPESVESNLRARGKSARRLPLTDRTWQFYTEYFRDFKANAGDEFEGIFGQDFVRAYEEQIAKLSRQM